MYQKNAMVVLKRIYKNVHESIENDPIAVDIQNNIYRQLRKILESTISELNLMIEYTYKGKKKVFHIEESVDTELEKNF